MQQLPIHGVVSSTVDDELVKNIANAFEIAHNPYPSVVSLGAPGSASSNSSAVAPTTLDRLTVERFKNMVRCRLAFYILNNPTHISGPS